MQTRIIANLCGQDAPDVVLQIRASHVTLIAQALDDLDTDDHGLATAFHSIRQMLAAGESAEH